MLPRASHSSSQARHACAASLRLSRLRAILFATSALASVGSMTTARAQNATWQGQDGTFEKDTNWNGGATPTGTASFGKSNQAKITSQSDQTVGTLQFNTGSSNYEFTIAEGIFGFSGDGIVTQSGAGAVKFIVDSQLHFWGASKAANATIVNNSVVNFSDGASADRARIENGPGAELNFYMSSKAGNATVVNSSVVNFDNSSSADHATIENGLGARVNFLATSTAGNATITSESGIIYFNDQASGGAARIIMKTSDDALDISGLTTDGTTIGSLEGKGQVRIDDKNLAIGGNNLSTAFGGNIHDLGLGGSLTKEGKGALTLTGVNEYTGATSVTGGALIVDGSIASSSGVTVEAGGTLAGTGTVSSTTVNDGGTLVASRGTLKVEGDLSFTSGATYSVQASSAGATSVTGTATLGDAKVVANFAKDGYVTKQYSILDAASINGSFGQLVTTNLLPIFSASLSQDPNHVFLNMSANGNSDSLRGFNVNQRNVMGGLANSFNQVGGISGAFATLSQSGLTQVSGETAVGTQQATFDAMGQFMGVMLDPTGGGRGAASPHDAQASMPRKAPVMEAFSSRWGVWAAGFGGSQSTNGDVALGSNKTTSGVYGSAVGADYRVSPNTVLGFALAGGGTSFRVANGGSGNSDLFQAGTYLRHTQGAAFIAAALAYGWQDVTTNRTVTAAGFDNLRGRFNANALSGRLEGGYRVAGAIMDVTPYAAGQFISYRLPSYNEQVASGANTFALAYGGKDVTASRTELGVRTERAFAQDDASLLTLRGRLAWAHDFNTDRNVQAAFVTLPGSAFTVNGAQAAANAALTSLSAELAWRSGWAASATFDGQFSDTTKSYAGKGVVRYAW
jgi:autotransporter-associated beta strand protein